MLKWLAGILGSIIVGLTIWSLTHEGGILNRRVSPGPPVAPVVHTPRVVMTEFEVDPARQNTSGNGRFTIYNDGDTPLEQCYVDYWIIQRDGRTTSQGISQSFGIPPKQTTVLSVGLYNWGGLDRSLHLGAQARCAGAVASTPVDRVVAIAP
jgi:hypothetical protein